MPQYLAKQKGFMNSVLYGPGTRRPIVVTDAPLKPVPSWLEPIKEESKAAAKQSEADKAVAKAKKDKELAENELKKAAATKQSVDVNFTSSKVETL